MEPAVPTTPGDLLALSDMLSVLETPDDARRLLCDLLTEREIAELARRLEVARLLDGGSSYVEVSRRTGASSTTVSRVSKCLNGQEGGYRLVLDRLCKRGRTPAS